MGTSGQDTGRSVREEDLAEDVVQADELEVGGEVGVYSVLTKELVVLDVVFLKEMRGDKAIHLPLLHA